MRLKMTARFRVVLCLRLQSRGDVLPLAASACEKARKGYVLAVPVNFAVTLRSGRKTTVAAVARLVPAAAWETRSCGPGCKGRRDYAWAWAATAAPRHWVLIVEAADAQWQNGLSSTGTSGVQFTEVDAQLIDVFLAGQGAQTPFQSSRAPAAAQH